MTVIAAEVAEGAGEGAAAGAGSRASAVRARGREYARRAPAAYGRQARETVGAARIPGDRAYQGIILAEFLIAVILVAGMPIVAGPSPNAKAKNSPSPYDTGDLKQLVAIGAVYFILALVSSGSRGRLAAWLGGLILIALGMGKLPQIKTAAVTLGQSGQGPTDQTV